MSAKLFIFTYMNMLYITNKKLTEILDLAGHAWTGDMGDYFLSIC